MLNYAKFLITFSCLKMVTFFHSVDSKKRGGNEVLFQRKVIFIFVKIIVAKAHKSSTLYLFNSVLISSTFNICITKIIVYFWQNQEILGIVDFPLGTG